ncbi:MAG: hypothetical protein ACYS30_06810 [Planctomycetota bacterium]|jgi:hypothetical protein
MTIRFNCPNCDALIAFPDKHSGKRARCLTCKQILIIPSRDGETPKKIEPETKPEIEKAVPLPGFYNALFRHSWKIFTNRANAPHLLFVATAVCFKFFMAHLNYDMVIYGVSSTFRFYLPLGHIFSIAAWGCLFWYYMEIIYSTAFDVEQLPDSRIGEDLGFIWNILKSVFIFLIVLAAVELPFIITAVILRKMGAEWPVLFQILMLGGLFLFPMAILTVAVGRDITLLRPDYFLIPIFRAFKPYIVVVALLVAFGLIEMQTPQYERGISLAITAGRLTLNLALQVIAIIAMRSIGLFYRHYSCHIPW